MRRNPAGSGKLRQWVRWTEGLKDSPSLLHTSCLAEVGQGPNTRGLFGPFCSPAGASRGAFSKPEGQNAREGKREMRALPGRAQLVLSFGFCSQGSSH